MGLKRSDGPEARRLPLPREVRVFCALLVAITLIAGLTAFCGYRSHKVETWWNPVSDPLMGDLMEYPSTYLLLHQAAFFDNASAGSLPAVMFSPVAYPPFAAALLAPLYLVLNPICGFLAISAIWLAFVFVGTRALLCEYGLSTWSATWLPGFLLFASFPIIRLVHQGNIELVVWIFVGTGTWSFVRDRNKTAGMLWGLAGAVKLYPAILLLLLVRRRNWPALSIGIVTVIIATWVSLWWLGPNVPLAWKGSLQNVASYQHLRASEWTLRELVANHSCFTWVKLLAQVLGIASAKVLPWYSLFGVTSFLAACKRLWSMPLTNQVLALNTFMLAFPSISYFHTLVHLYIPLVMLICVAVQAQQKDLMLRGTLGTLLLFLLLLAPYTVLLYPRALIFSGLLQSFVLGILFLCALQFPFPLVLRAPRPLGRMRCRTSAATTGC